MAHHKRRRPKHQRAGCLMCKPWKSKATARGRFGSAPSKQDNVAQEAAEARSLPHYPFLGPDQQ